MTRIFKKLAAVVAFALLTVAIVSNIKPNATMLRHVVLFKFKETATPEQVKSVETAFEKLPSQIPTIKAFEWGVNNSPEKLNEGLTHCFFVTFSSEKDRNNYLVDPAHKAFVALLTPYLDKPVVFDYWTK